MKNNKYSCKIPRIFHLHVKNTDAIGWVIDSEHKIRLFCLSSKSSIFFENDDQRVMIYRIDIKKHPDMLNKAAENIMSIIDDSRIKTIIAVYWVGGDWAVAAIHDDCLDVGIFR